MDFFSGLKPKPDDLKLVIALVVAYYGLKMEIQENRIVNQADKAIINFRLNDLENKLSSSNIPHLATLPRETKIEEEK